MDLFARLDREIQERRFRSSALYHFIHGDSPEDDTTVSGDENPAPSDNKDQG